MDEFGEWMGQVCRLNAILTVLRGTVPRPSRTTAGAQNPSALENLPRRMSVECGCFQRWDTPPVLRQREGGCGYSDAGGEDVLCREVAPAGPQYPIHSPRCVRVDIVLFLQINAVHAHNHVCEAFLCLSTSPSATHLSAVSVCHLSIFL